MSTKTDRRLWLWFELAVWMVLTAANVAVGLIPGHPLWYLVINIAVTMIGLQTIARQFGKLRKEYGG